MYPDLRQQPQQHADGRLYTAFGLLIASEVALPDLFLARGDARPADVKVRIGDIPQLDAEEQSGFTVRGSAALLNVPAVGRYWINAGCEIIIAPTSGVSDRDLRLYLLGSAFGALLHQRRVLPLHANVIEIAGKAVAFSGKSGAGKSTLAAWFHDRGYRMISDDVCAITFSETGRPIVQGGLPRLRLCRDALAASGRSAHDFEQSFDGVNKYDVPAPSGAPMGAVPLGAVYMLDPGSSSHSSGSISRLVGVDAVDALVTNTYRGAFAREMGAAQQNLMACLSVINSAPLYRAYRRWGFEHFEFQARKLEQHAQKSVSVSA